MSDQRSDASNQKPSFFLLFELPQTFTIDLSYLEKKYFELQRAFHPDRFAGKPEAERIAALQKSTDINQAYEILKNPLKRAEYILALQGLTVNIDNAAVKPSVETLHEAMEMRERLDEDSAEDLTRENTDARMIILSQLEKFFAAKRWNDAAQMTIRLKYIEKYDEEILLRARKKVS